LETLLGEFVLLNVGLVEVKAGLEDFNELIWWVLFVVPQDGVVDWASLLALSLLSSGELTNWGHTKLEATEVDDVETAVSDHLVGDLDEETSHALISVVVTGDGVDHLDGVHKGRESVLDALGSTIVKGFDEFLKGLEVLDVVFGLVESLSNAQFNASPLAGGKVDLVTGAVSVVVGVLGGESKDVEHSTAVLGAELL